MFLQWLDITGTVARLPLEPQMAPVTIGRTRDCAVYSKETSVSRLHAQIAWELDGYVLTDMGSSNGTFINGARQTRGRLVPGDVARCGEVLEIRVLVDQLAQAETDAPTQLADMAAKHTALQTQHQQLSEELDRVRTLLRQAEESTRQAERARADLATQLEAGAVELRALRDENQRLEAIVGRTGDAVVRLERTLAVLQDVLDEKESLIDQLRATSRPLATQN